MSRWRSRFILAFAEWVTTNRPKDARVMYK
jgi:hypothetical protein